MRLSTRIIAAIGTALVLILLVQLLVAKPSLRIGVWITDLISCEQGSVEAIAEKARKHRLAYIIVRTHGLWHNGVMAQKATWYKTCPPNAFKALLTACRTRGIKVYAWSYLYGTPGKEQLEIDMVKAALDAGVDGYVANAEAEFTSPDRFDRASRIASAINAYAKTKSPRPFMAYSSFARITPKTRGYDFPAILFNQAVDAVMPQTYWKDFLWRPDFAVREIDRQWAERYKAWTALDGQDQRNRKAAIRTLIHTGQAYRDGIRGVRRAIPASELRVFLATLREDEHREANIWRWDYMGEDHWKVVSEFTRR